VKQTPETQSEKARRQEAQRIHLSMYHARRQEYNKLIFWIRVAGIAVPFGDVATREYTYHPLSESNVEPAQCIADVTPLMMKPEECQIHQSSSCPFFLET
jgi:hypothetical protein